MKTSHPLSAEQTGGPTHLIESPVLGTSQAAPVHQVLFTTDLMST